VPRSCHSLPFPSLIDSHVLDALDYYCTMYRVLCNMPIAAIQPCFDCRFRKETLHVESPVDVREIHSVAVSYEYYIRVHAVLSAETLFHLRLWDWNLAGTFGGTRQTNLGATLGL
jgi:hypothetical protein